MAVAFREIGIESVRMSFNSAFLSPSSTPAEREREARRELAAERAYAVRAYYKSANALILGAIVLIMLPQSSLAPWILNIVGGVACVVTSLALLMLVNRALWKALLTLIFGWIIVPGWYLAAPTVTKVAYEQYQVIAEKWRRSMEEPGKPQ